NRLDLADRTALRRGAACDHGGHGEQRDRGAEAVGRGHQSYPSRLADCAIASSSGMFLSSSSSAAVTICCAERPLTAEASLSLRCRDGSRRSVNADFDLPPGAERVLGARRGTGFGVTAATAGFTA